LFYFITAIFPFAAQSRTVIWLTLEADVRAGSVSGVRKRETRIGRFPLANGPRLAYSRFHRHGVTNSPANHALLRRSDRAPGETPPGPDASDRECPSPRALWRGGTGIHHRSPS